ncbi:unnamed protein product [Arabis nemorensis]|uniref:Mei2-like C-terminal RNA recognition motif domain-containing protein n=1 Tax=Arabis nemorensis TaxID=586526 RepID=A0A565BEQ4_9BRAS|nr:unnamed protein product [Arabis nemorensis]
MEFLSPPGPEMSPTTAIEEEGEGFGHQEPKLIGETKRANLGYAFVNFTSSIAAVRFYREFDKFFWANQRTKKICEINTAKFQGKEELSRHFKESKFPCHTDEYLPVVLSPPSDGFTAYKLKTLGFRVGFRGGASRRA